MAERKRLSDILQNSERERLEKAWQVTAAATDLGPVPAGEYRCRVASGELFNSRSGTPGYKITFEVIEGEHAGRRAWHDVWLSEAALPMAKRDLAKLGVDRPEQLERPLPSGLIATVKVALRRNDDGTEFNRVARFEVVAVEKPGPDPFAPKDEATGAGASDADGFDWSTGHQRNGVQTSS